MEKSVNSEINIDLTNWMGKWICILLIHYLLIYYSSNQVGRLYNFFFKTHSGHRMWGGHVFLSWNIIEKSLKFFRGLSVGTLWLRVCINIMPANALMTSLVRASAGKILIHVQKNKMEKKCKRNEWKKYSKISNGFVLLFDLYWENILKVLQNVCWCCFDVG